MFLIMIFLHAGTCSPGRCGYKVDKDWSVQASAVAWPKCIDRTGGWLFIFMARGAGAEQPPWGKSPFLWIPGVVALREAASGLKKHTRWCAMR